MKKGKSRKVVAGVLYEDGKACAWCGRPMTVAEQMRWPSWVHDQCFYEAYPSFRRDYGAKGQ